MLRPRRRRWPQLGPAARRGRNARAPKPISSMHQRPSSAPQPPWSSAASDSAACALGVCSLRTTHVARVSASVRAWRRSECANVPNNSAPLECSGAEEDQPVWALVLRGHLFLSHAAFPHCERRGERTLDLLARETGAGVHWEFGVQSSADLAHLGLPSHGCADVRSGTHQATAVLPHCERWMGQRRA